MIAFFLGLVIGGALGVLIMCLCIASGDADHHEEQHFGKENRFGKRD